MGISVGYLIDMVFEVLPADSYADIADKINTAHGVGVPFVTRRQVSHALRVLRSNQPLYGWTVPHCRRGRSYPNRLFVVVGDNRDELRFDDQQQDDLAHGAIGTCSQAHTQLHHLALQLAMARSYIASPRRRRALTRLIEDLEFTARRAVEAKENIEEDLAVA